VREGVVEVEADRADRGHLEIPIHEDAMAPRDPVLAIAERPRGRLARSGAVLRRRRARHRHRRPGRFRGTAGAKGGDSISGASGGARSSASGALASDASSAEVGRVPAGGATGDGGGEAGAPPGFFGSGFVSVRSGLTRAL
jgi:hypothetical protein